MGGPGDIKETRDLLPRRPLDMKPERPRLAAIKVKASLGGSVTAEDVMCDREAPRDREEVDV